MNIKQRRFADEYLKDRNGKQAAIRAGYAPGSAEVTASRLLSHAKVSAYIAKQVNKRSEKLQIDAEWVLREAADLYVECRREGDRSQANKCLDTIGKHIDVQAFKDKVDLTSSDGSMIPKASVSLDAAAIKAIAKQLDDEC